MAKFSMGEKKKVWNMTIWYGHAGFKISASYPWAHSVADSVTHKDFLTEL